MSRRVWATGPSPNPYNGDRLGTLRSSEQAGHTPERQVGAGPGKYDHCDGPRVTARPAIDAGQRPARDPGTEQKDHNRGDGRTEPDGVEQQHLQAPDDEAAPLGDDGVEGNQVEEPGEVGGYPRYQRRGQRRVAKPSDDRRLLAGALVAPWRLPSPCPYTNGKPKRRQFPE